MDGNKKRVKTFNFVSTFLLISRVLDFYELRMRLGRAEIMVIKGRWTCGVRRNNTAPDGHWGKG